MDERKAAKIIKQKIQEEHGITPRVTWREWGATKYPSGLKGHYGFCTVEAHGFKPTSFVFTSDTTGNWRMHQTNR